MAFLNFQPEFPPFTGKYYVVWAIKMGTMLQAHDVRDYVQFGFLGPKNEAEEQALSNTEREQWKKYKKKNAQVQQLIQHKVDRAMFQKIMIMSLAQVLWDTLATNYTGTTKVNIVKLQNTRRDFESLQIKEKAKDLTSMTVDEVMGSLLLHEARIDRNKDSTLETALNSQVYISREKGRGKGLSGRNGGQRDG